MSVRPEQHPPAGLVDVRGDLPPDHPLVGLMALGAYRCRQLTIYDALGAQEEPLFYLPRAYDDIDRPIGFLDEVPDRFGPEA